jgi:hypothetical protein
MAASSYERARFLLTIITRGVRFEIAGPDRTVIASDPGSVVDGADRIFLRAVKQEVRALLLRQAARRSGRDGVRGTRRTRSRCQRCARGIRVQGWR